MKPSGTDGPTARFHEVNRVAADAAHGVNAAKLVSCHQNPQRTNVSLRTSSETEACAQTGRMISQWRTMLLSLVCP
jgi:hypothetical protein